MAGVARGARRDLSALLEPLRRASSCPALAAAVFSSAGLVAIGSTGYSRRGTLSSSVCPPASEAKWHIGSCTKAMTATLVGLAIDRGALRFTDTLGDIFGSESVHPGRLHVTVDDVLRHKGGFPSDIPPSIWEGMQTGGFTPGTRAQAVTALLALPPAQQPGVCEYSTAGYMVLGAALERKEGRPWEEVMTEELFKPLGMTSAGFGAPRRGSDESPWGHRVGCFGHVPVDPFRSKSDNPHALGPAGTVHCTLEDWGHFLRVHLAAARNEAPSALPLSLDTLRHLHEAEPGLSGARDVLAPLSGKSADGVERFACGWVTTTRSWAQGWVLCHSGSNTMWHVTAWLAPAADRAFVAATNCGADPTFALALILSRSSARI